MARRFGGIPLVAAYGGVVMVASVVIGLLAVPPTSVRSTMVLPQLWQLTETLRRHDLRRGYGGYWESTIVTAISERQITSLPLLEDQRGLRTFNWFCNLDWFRSAARDWHGRVFFVVASQPGGLELSESAVKARFGEPAERIDLGQFVIDVYDLPPHALDVMGP